LNRRLSSFSSWSSSSLVASFAILASLSSVGCSVQAEGEREESASTAEAQTTAGAIEFANTPGPNESLVAFHRRMTDGYQPSLTCPLTADDPGVYVRWTGPKGSETYAVEVYRGSRTEFIRNFKFQRHATYTDDQGNEVFRMFFAGSQVVDGAGNLWMLDMTKVNGGSTWNVSITNQRGYVERRGGCHPG
jgi:hypothetical protein